jgi:organic radical activating enzyme
MEKITNMQELADFFAGHREVILYGAGHVGKLLLSYVEKCAWKDRIRCLAVSDVCSNPESVKGIPVVGIEEITFTEQAVILVAVMEKAQEEIKKEHPQMAEQFGVSDALVGMLNYYENIVNSGDNNLNRDDNNLVDMLSKSIPNQMLAFSVHLCEHCNLNCAGCNNFAPLASEEYTDLSQFTSDMKRLSELAQGEAYRIQLTGGEPLLNPNAIEYALIARKYFPHARISFISNGLLLKQQSDEFFGKCVANNIDIDLTPYPIKLDYRELGEFLEGKGIIWKYQDGIDIKTMRKEIFDLNPNNPQYRGNHNWLKCFMANNCVQLNKGRLACTKIQCAHHFIKYFEKECERMWISPRDSIDIYQVNTIDEIFDFFAKPFPFCRYCDVDKMQDTEWKVSERNISEWV